MHEPKVYYYTTYIFLSDWEQIFSELLSKNDSWINNNKEIFIMPLAVGDIQLLTNIYDILSDITKLHVEEQLRSLCFHNFFSYNYS